MQSMPPELFLLTFLPILLYGSGSSLDWHTFFRNLPQIMTLAFPGVGLHMVLVAVIYKLAFPYDWSWTQSFLYGAIISATDPVAVVRSPVPKCPTLCATNLGAEAIRSPSPTHANEAP